jgi:hypothetical protein
LPDVHQRKSDEVSPDTIEVSSFNKFNWWFICCGNLLQKYYIVKKQLNSFILLSLGSNFK